LPVPSVRFVWNGSDVTVNGITFHYTGGLCKVRARINLPGVGARVEDDPPREYVQDFFLG
jgi:hypothetical protein